MPHSHTVFACTVVLLAAAAVPGLCMKPLRVDAPPLGYKPNIVFVLTDDQDRLLGQSDKYTQLGSLAAMPRTQEYLMEGGAWFENSFVNTPICCPSRTESFTGRYFHNVRAAKGGCMHVNAWQNVFNTSASMFSLMQAAGYQTGVFGKVTNDQGHAYWDPSKQSTWMAEGMTHIDSPIDYNDFDGLRYFRKFANGSKHVETLSKTSPRFGTTYQTAQIGNRTLEWLDQVGASDTPFFAYVGHFYDDTVAAPLLPNYNVSCADKPSHIRQNPALSGDVKCWEDQMMRDRWASLRAVDDVVDAIVTKLKALGTLDKTFIFYSSDHGYKLGSWRVGVSKQHPYETDVRVPLMVRGPKVATGSQPSLIVGNVDLTPTFLELAGAQPVSFVDGHSLTHALIPTELPASTVTSRSTSWRDRFLNEYLSVGTYYNDHSQIWYDSTSGPTGSWQCGKGSAGPRSPPGVDPKSECKESHGVGDGNCYFVDSTASNSYRSLRIINSTHNMAYIEYDSTYTWSGSAQFYELYDLHVDPYQLTNIYNTTSSGVKAELAASLAQYYECAGATCL